MATKLSHGDLLIAINARCAAIQILASRLATTGCLITFKGASKSFEEISETHRAGLLDCLQKLKPAVDGMWEYLDNLEELGDECEIIAAAEKVAVRTSI